MNRIILFTFYLSDTVSQSCLSSIIKLFKDSNLFFETIDYSITYLSPNSSYKPLHRTGRYSEKRITDFYNYHKEFQSVLCSSIEIHTRSHKIDFKTLDIAYSILYSTGDTFNTITIAISEDCASEIDFKALAINSINNLISDNGGLFYGTTHYMEASKLPLLYVNGISNNNLDGLEIESVERLQEHSNDIRNKIWKISWGNLINSRQFIDDQTPVILSNKRYLKTIEFSDSLMWFNFDCDIKEYTNYSRYHQREILTYFRDKLL